MNALELRQFIIEPVLFQLDMYSQRAVALLIMIAAHESGDFKHIRQYSRGAWGPAIGLYQMEPPTLFDLWHNYLVRRKDIRRRVRAWVMKAYSEDAPAQLYNPFYATATARVQLWRVPEPLPETLPELAVYAKRHWNSSLGKASVNDYLSAAGRHIDAIPEVVRGA